MADSDAPMDNTVSLSGTSKEQTSGFTLSISLLKSAFSWVTWVVT
jgi:hypothetical protein